MVGKGIRKTCHRWDTPWQAHELTFSCLRRQAFLSRQRTRQYMAAAIQRARRAKGFHVWGYVIMPEHVHLLLWPACETYATSSILQAIKQPVARRAIRWLKTANPCGLQHLATGDARKPYRFWQAGGGFDRNVRSGEAPANMLTYIHENPVRRGLVKQAEDWIWSSAADWADVRAGPVVIDKESFLASLA